MSLKDYWTLTPQTQDKVIAKSQPTPSYLKPPRPKGCKCKVGDAHECAKKKFLSGGKMQTLCYCICHTETGGFD